MDKTNRERLVAALIAALDNAPEEKRRDLAAALDGYIKVYPRTIKSAPPLLASLLEAVADGSGLTRW